MAQPKARVTTTLDLEPIDYQRGLDELKNNLIQSAGFPDYNVDTITVEFEGLEGVA